MGDPMYENAEDLNDKARWRMESEQRHADLPLFPSKIPCAVCGTEYHDGWSIKRYVGLQSEQGIKKYNGKPYLLVTCIRCGAVRDERPLNEKKKDE